MSSFPLSTSGRQTGSPLEHLGGLPTWKCRAQVQPPWVGTKMDLLAVSYSEKDTCFVNLHTYLEFAESKGPCSFMGMVGGGGGGPRSDRNQVYLVAVSKAERHIDFHDTAHFLDHLADSKQFATGTFLLHQSAPISGGCRFESAVQLHGSMQADARRQRHMYPKWGLRGPEPWVDLHPGMAKYELFTTGSSPMRTVSSIV